MTREEAIEELERLLRHWDDLENDKRRFWGYDNEAVALALTALRPVSREHVEKVWRGCKMCSGWNKIKLKPCANGDLGVQADIGSAGKGDTFGLVVYNHLLASGYVDFPFCPFCGKPMTDEGVQMAMERLEALKDAVD